MADVIGPILRLLSKLFGGNTAIGKDNQINTVDGNGSALATQGATVYQADTINIGAQAPIGEAGPIEIVDTPGITGGTWYAVDYGDQPLRILAKASFRLVNRGALSGSVVQTRVAATTADGGRHELRVSRDAAATVRTRENRQLNLNLSQARPGVERIAQEGQVVRVAPDAPVDVEVVARGSVDTSDLVTPVQVTVVCTDQAGTESERTVEASEMGISPSGRPQLS